MSYHSVYLIFFFLLKELNSMTVIFNDKSSLDEINGLVL